jgi:hypothetical protein
MNEEASFRRNKFQDISKGQLKLVNSLFGQYLKGKHDPVRTHRVIRLDILSYIMGRRINSSEELTSWQASCIIGLLKITTNSQDIKDFRLSRLGGEFLAYCESATARRGQDSQGEGKIDSADEPVSGNGNTTLPLVQDSNSANDWI